jgi:hypothetical protein
MACTLPDIPQYLHFNFDKKVFDSKDFDKRSILFRTGNSAKENPIEFPSKATSISLSWGKIIKLQDVLKVYKSHNSKTKDDSVYYGLSNEITAYKLERCCNISGIYEGNHVIKTIVKHTPVECNYSHSEILIHHIYFENMIPKESIIEYQDWENSIFKKIKGNQKPFIKELELKYRGDMAILLRRNTQSLKKSIFARVFPKKIILEFFLRYKIWDWDKK